jgi:hypothetical protein
MVKQYVPRTSVLTSHLPSQMRLCWDANAELQWTSCRNIGQWTGADSNIPINCTEVFHSYRWISDLESGLVAKERRDCESRVGLTMPVCQWMTTIV